MNSLSSEDSSPALSAETRALDWWVTSRCNLRCDFCHGPTPDPRESRDLRGRILDAICGSSATHVTVCGGEPLVVKALPEIVRRLALAGKQVVLNTNGELLDESMARALRIGKFVRIVGISLDGHTAALHRTMRGAEASFERSVRAARMVASTKGVALKIGTVVSRVNVSHAAEMSNLVDSIGADVWRLYQFAPRNGNDAAEARHLIAVEDFWRYVTLAGRLATRTAVSPSSVAQSRGCFIVGHDGALIEPTLRGHRICGHALHDSIDSLWSGPSDRQATVLQNKHWLRLSLPAGAANHECASPEGRAHQLPTHCEERQRDHSTS